ncbi:T-cell receptor-associated transmembrane adapter 1 [Nothoprocta perdicaria]|uniref:T-cell receptor-associated transmembrane adapter 1 n=1 Tax=Nothoprocta perdicaria TaxID=30464 RepID=UPI000E1BB024|nr:T-cell receptor-associated transmembrane adapter 1 [Nothoprocta perdicaria]
MDCHFSVWGVLAFLSLALIVSLIFNISQYIRKKREDKMYKDYEDCSPSYDYFDTGDDSVYGNLSQDILEECCYEQMKSQPQRPVNEQVEPANQMCYASLDHSIKGKRRKPRRKKESSEEDQEERPSKPTVMPSIYLNSEQLAAENPAKAEAVHDDPIRLMGLIHATKENV